MKKKPPKEQASIWEYIKKLKPKKKEQVPCMECPACDHGHTCRRKVWVEVDDED